MLWRFQNIMFLYLQPPSAKQHLLQKTKIPHLQTSIKAGTHFHSSSFALRPPTMANLLKCRKCESNFQNLYQLRNHEAITHRTYVCPFCPKINAGFHSYCDHIRTRHLHQVIQHIRRAWSCWKCQKNFASKIRLEQHGKFCKKICPKCGQHFQTANTHQRHICIGERGLCR